MTAKEKAKEIYYKYLKLHSTSNQMKFRALDSSLLLVNEILENLEPLCLSHLGTYENPKIYYFTKVKQEIEKL